MAFCSAQAIRPPRRISRPVKMFSETVSSANSCGSWYTVAMPSAMASPVDAIVVGRPSNSIAPVSAASTPEMILIIVDFPAPFSPTRACTRPARIVMSALRMARTAPKRFEIPVRCRRAGSDEAVASAGGAGASGAFDGWSTVMVLGLRCRGVGPRRTASAGASPRDQ